MDFLLFFEVVLLDEAKLPISEPASDAMSRPPAELLEPVAAPSTLVKRFEILSLLEAVFDAVSLC